jgi:3-dehydroquinate synthase
LFEKTERFLGQYPPALFERHFQDAEFAARLSGLLAAQVAFKAKIVQGDEKESPDNMGAGSRKILNFGHTLAHSLEKVTEYRYLKHGEAVGYGIRFAAELSKKLELLGRNEVELLNDVVQRAGVLPSLRGIDSARVIETFKFDKKLVNDSLHWILLTGIGKPVIVPNKDIPQSVLRAAIEEILEK